MSDPFAGTEAVDRTEQLRAEIERLTAGYRRIIERWEIAKNTPGQVWPMEVEREVAEDMVDIALRALEQKS